MQIKNLSEEETASLLVLAGRVAMGNTEFEELTKNAAAMLEDMEQRRARLAIAMRDLDTAAAELNYAWDACPQFRLAIGQPKWFPSFDEMAHDIHHWVNCNLSEVDPFHTPAPDPEDVPAARQAAVQASRDRDDDIPF